MIQTGISAIYTMNPLERRQKQCLLFVVRLPHKEIVGQVCPQASLVKCKDVTDHSSENLRIVCGAMDVSTETARYFRHDFEKTGSVKNVVLFMNSADDPAIECIVTPLALTAAESFAHTESSTFSPFSRTRLRMAMPGKRCQQHKGRFPGVAVIRVVGTRTCQHLRTKCQSGGSQKHHLTGPNLHHAQRRCHWAHYREADSR